MTNKFIFEPSIHVVAQTVINPEGLSAWADEQDLLEVMSDGTTPLGYLWHDLMENDEDVSLDALPEFAGRHCYRSFSKGRKREEYLKNIIEMEHGSVLEHSTISMALSGISRSLTHELIRHRPASPSQESQRYVSADKINFVVPPLIHSLTNNSDGDVLWNEFEKSCYNSLESYKTLVNEMERITTTGHSSDIGVKLATMRKKRILEAARAVLPNAAETRLTWTMNMRIARHVCALRGGEGADLEIRGLAVAMTRVLKDKAPIIFDDFAIYVADDGFEAVSCERPKV